MKKYKKIGSLIGCTILACGVITSAPFIVTACGRTLKDLSLTAITDNPNQSNHGEWNNGEISFNTYDNNDLHISVARNIGNADLQWQWSDTIDGDYNNIDFAIGNTGLFIDKTAKDKISISATQSNRNQFTFKDFYVRANIKNKLLSSEPILIHFHNAPEILSAGGIITCSGTNITTFAPSTDLLKYDTIYIPKEFQAIYTNIFNDRFNGTYNNCQSIQNIIFEDRNLVSGIPCDVGNNAFSSSTNLVLSGEIYIGSGEYNCNGSTNLARFFSASSSVTMNDIVINGDCRCIGKTSDFFSGSSITVGDVNINGNCICAANGDDSISNFFSGSSSVNAGNVTINGNCNVNAKNDSKSNNRALFFSAYAAASSSSVVVRDVIIDGDCICAGNSPGFYALFFSAIGGSSDYSSITANDITINGNCNCNNDINTDNSSLLLFFSTMSSSPSINMIDVTINGNCNCGNTDTTTISSALFFSTMAVSASASSSSIIMRNVTINGDCSCSANDASASYSFLFSAIILYGFASSSVSVVMGDVAVNGDCSCSANDVISMSATSLFSAYAIFVPGGVSYSDSITIKNVTFQNNLINIKGKNDGKYFFYGDSTSSLQNLAQNASSFVTNGIPTDNPLHYNDGKTWWPIWSHSISHT